jgi:basic membrane protein A and related proteins
MMFPMMRRTAWAATALAALATSAMVIGSGTAGASTSAGRTAKATFSACLVTDTSGINDHSFNELTWQGLRAAKAAAPRKIGKITYLVSTTTADYVPNIDAFIAERCGIIVTVGFLMADATQSAAQANPHQRFAIVDCTYTQQCLSGKHLKNIDQIGFDTVQDAFLGGYLAAGESKTHLVATYGGENFGTVTIYMDGFWDGVQYYNSQQHAHVKVLGWNEKTQKGTFIGNFFDVGAAQALTNSYIGEGADVVFPVAGGAGLGTVKAAQAAAPGKSVAVEWSDTDGCYSLHRYCKYFLTSVTKAIATEVKNIVVATASGKFKSLTIGTLANGGVALAPYHDYASKIPAKLRAELIQVAAKIESGKIRPATKSPV